MQTDTTTYSRVREGSVRIKYVDNRCKTQRRLTWKIWKKQLLSINDPSWLELGIPVGQLAQSPTRLSLWAFCSLLGILLFFREKFNYVSEQGRMIVFCCTHQILPQSHPTVGSNVRLWRMLTLETEWVWPWFPSPPVLSKWKGANTSFPAPFAPVSSSFMCWLAQIHYKKHLPLKTSR